MKFQAQYYADKGFTTAAISYRDIDITDSTTGFDLVQDCKDAVKYMRKNLNFDKLVIMGESSGGHLAVELGLDDEVGADFVVAFNPVLDVLNAWTYVAKTDEDRKKLSPVFNTKKTSTKFLIMHGNADEAVNYKTSKNFSDNMKLQGTSCEYIELDGEPHSFIISRYRSTDEKVFQFMGMVDEFFDELGLYQSLDICDYYKNKKVAVTLTMDDGDYPSAVVFNEEFKDHNACGTAMLITNTLEKNNTVEQWQELIKDGYIDVGNHSTTHSYKYMTDYDKITSQILEYDITNAYNKLKEWFPDSNILTFATPYGEDSLYAKLEIMKNHYANRVGVFKSKRSPNNPSKTKWKQLDSYLYAGQDASQMNKWVNDAMEDKGWVIELLHGCREEKVEKSIHIDRATLCEHLTFLEENESDVWVGSFNDVTAYIYERQNATLECVATKENYIRLALADNLPDDKFYHPLTIKVSVPNSWTGVIYTQNKKTEEIDIIKENDMSYIY